MDTTLSRALVTGVAAAALATGVTVTSAAPANAVEYMYGLKATVPSASVYVWIPGGRTIKSIGCAWRNPRDRTKIHYGGCRARVVVVDKTGIIRRVLVLIPGRTTGLWAQTWFYAPYAP